MNDRNTVSATQTTRAPCVETMKDDTLAVSIKLNVHWALSHFATPTKGGNMAVVLRATTPGFTAAKYDELLQKLEAAGAGSPAGRLYHVCFGDTDNLRVSDIWESREAFDRFGETLIPIMQDLGIAPPQIEFFEVHNIIEGRKATATSSERAKRVTA